MSDENRSVELDTVVFGNSNPPKSSMNMPDELLSVGDILCGSYILRARLGRGGMGEIWKADEVYEGEILRTVVIKTLASNVQNVQEELGRVQAMFHRIHSLQHQHICPMYAMKSDVKAGTIIIMKYIDGIMLQEYYSQYFRMHNEFPVSEVVRLLMPIAQALDYSHTKKVLHRDVKPQNIMVSKDESDGVQLIDFGLVMEMRSSFIENTSVHFDGSGTLPYMSPEQWSGDFQDAKADQFSLAVVVYELLAGRLPFSGNNIQILGFQIMNKNPDPIPNVPDYINFALQKALSKDRKQRFKTCSEFIGALEKPIITESTLAKAQDASAEGAQSMNAKMDKGVLLNSFTGSAFSKMTIILIAGAGALVALLLLALCLLLLRSSDKMIANAQKDGNADNSTVFRNEIPTELVNPPHSSRIEENIVQKETQAPSPENVGNTNPATTPEAAPEAISETIAEPKIEQKNEPKAESQTEPEPKAENTPVPVTPAEVETAPVPQTEVVSEPEISPDELLNQARTAYEQRDFATAYQAYQQLPQETLATEDLDKYAVSCEALGRFFTATHIREVLLLQNATPDGLKLGVQDSIQADDPKHALQWVEMLLKENPDSPEFLSMQATALNINAVLRNDPTLARKAVEIYNGLLEKDAENAELYALRGAVYLENPAFFQKALDLAKADFDHALKLAPENVSALLYHGIMMRDVYGQKVVARRNFEEILRIDAQNLEAQLQLGITLTQDLPDLALDYFTRYLEVRPEKCTAYIHRGKLYLQQKRHVDAVADFNECILQNENDFATRKLRADTSVLLKHWRDAKIDYDFLIQNDLVAENQVEYYLGLARVYDGAKKRKQAEDARETAEQIRLKGLP